MSFFGGIGGDSRWKFRLPKCSRKVCLKVFSKLSVTSVGHLFKQALQAVPIDPFNKLPFSLKHFESCHFEQRILISAAIKLFLSVLVVIIK